MLNLPHTQLHIFTFFEIYHFCQHQNDGLYDFVLFVQCSKQERSKRAAHHRKFWCVNVPVVYLIVLLLLLYHHTWYLIPVVLADFNFLKKFISFFVPKRSPYLHPLQFVCPTIEDTRPCLQ